MLGSAALGQNQVSTQDLWVLDFGTSTLHIFEASGFFQLSTITLGGSGSARGFAFNDAGLAYVARGQDVRTYDTVTTSVFANAASGIDQAQDVAVRPGAAQEVWVACGTAPANSKIIKYSSTGTALQTLTNPNLDHPRRIVFNSDGTKLFVTSVNNKRIFTVDPATSAFTQLADLTIHNILPIGLAYDSTRNAVWVSGDFGASARIGFCDAITGTYNNVISPNQFPTLRSPANIYFDRYRVLNVAARNLNNGLPGVHRYSAQLGTMIADLGKFAGSLTSVIDMAPRPELMGIGAPTLGADYVLNASLSGGVSNPITFHAPRAPNAPYAVAMSPRWQTNCAPHVPGIYEVGLGLPFPEARAIPLSLADGGFLVSQTAGVCCFPATPFPINTVLGLSGFAGMLDGFGQATAFVDFLPATPAINGVQLSLAFVTADFGVLSGFGRISDPICLTINVGP